MAHLRINTCRDETIADVTTKMRERHSYRVTELAVDLAIKKARETPNSAVEWLSKIDDQLCEGVWISTIYERYGLNVNE